MPLPPYESELLDILGERGLFPVGSLVYPIKLAGGNIRPYLIVGVSSELASYRLTLTAGPDDYYMVSFNLIHKTCNTWVSHVVTPDGTFHVNTDGDMK